MLPLVLVAMLVLCAGVVECCYGRTNLGAIYGSDAVQYLDIARALHAGNWRLAMNPLWGLGYPLLLALLHLVFPAGPAGDLFTVRFLNSAIFTATGLSFFYLVKALIPASDHPGQSVRKEFRGVLLIGGTGIFVATQLCIDSVSRVGPDQLLSCLFFLTCGLLLQMTRKATMTLAILCGLTMGFGYVTKQAFLLLGCVVLLELCLALRQKTLQVRHIVLCAAVFATVVLAYASTLTAALGRPTLGEAGSLNYAWHVNRLEKWVHWEGGALPAAQAWPNAAAARFAQWTNHTPDFGRPLHPSRIVGADPKIFAFGQPFPVTYPPYYNPPWWYEGYRHLWNWRYQAIAVAYNCLELGQTILFHPVLDATALAVLLLALWCKDPWSSWLSQLWPIVLIALAQIALYIPVHLEGRYIAPALAVLAMVLLVGPFTQTPVLSVRRRNAILAIFLAGLLLEVGVSQRDVLRRIARRESYAQNVEWKAAGLLASAGLTPDTPIATISWEPSLHCDWAYIAGLHITSEIATSADWKQFWALPPAGQKQALERFRSTGAVALVAWNLPDLPMASGWERMGDLPVWVYRL